jgi:O-antigen ligase
MGTGPGTFQRPYEQLKSPEAEMARLAHNDYLEQFSDSGIVGGVFYAAWIVLSLATIGRQVWRFGEPMTFALFAGLLGWFVQGFGEFSLYIPALAWTAFTLLGCLLALAGNQIDKNPVTGYSSPRT